MRERVLAGFASTLEPASLFYLLGQEVKNIVEDEIITVFVFCLFGGKVKKYIRNVKDNEATAWDCIT